MKRYCIKCEKETVFKEIKPWHYRCNECGSELVVISDDYELWSIT